MFRWAAHHHQGHKIDQKKDGKHYSDMYIRHWITNTVWKILKFLVALPYMRTSLHVHGVNNVYLKCKRRCIMSCLQCVGWRNSYVVTEKGCLKFHSEIKECVKFCSEARGCVKVCCETKRCVKFHTVTMGCVTCSETTGCVMVWSETKRCVKFHTDKGMCGGLLQDNGMREDLLLDKRVREFTVWDKEVREVSITDKRMREVFDAKWCVRGQSETKGCMKVCSDIRNGWSVALMPEGYIDRKTFWNASLYSSTAAVLHAPVALPLSKDWRWAYLRGSGLGRAPVLRWWSTDGHFQWHTSDYAVNQQISPLLLKKLTLQTCNTYIIFIILQ
jgi:hypothetical protein